MTAEEKQPDYLGHRERLRKRFLKDEGRSMPDYELLELLLMTAIPRRDVKPLAKKLLAKFKSFAGVISAPIEELMAEEGIKENSATVLKLVKAAAVRMSWQKLENEDAPVIANWDSLIDYCRSSMAYKDIEEFKIIFLNNKLKIIDEEVQQRGTATQVSIHPREVIKSAVNKEASAIILVHNHPSGDTTPSRADIEVTKQINEACKLVSIQLLDHVIISQNTNYSFKDHGLI